tara:strand:- start:603 stop:749 length:147 start_codon:yes stop_codon:yes gene_type:complete
MRFFGGKSRKHYSRVHKKSRKVGKSRKPKSLRRKSRKVRKSRKLKGGG